MHAKNCQTYTCRLLEGETKSKPQLFVPIDFGMCRAKSGVLCIYECMHIRISVYSYTYTCINIFVHLFVPTDFGVARKITRAVYV